MPRRGDDSHRCFASYLVAVPRNEPCERPDADTPMKSLLATTAIAISVFAPFAASAADFGGEEAPPAEAFIVTPPPVLFGRPYNYTYEENGVYYAPTYPMPYFGLFPQAGPEIAFYPQPAWWARPAPPPMQPRRSRPRRW